MNAIVSIQRIPACKCLSSMLLQAVGPPICACMDILGRSYEGVKGLICLCFQGAPGSFGSPGLSGEQVSNVHTRLGAWK